MPSYQFQVEHKRKNNKIEKITVIAPSFHDAEMDVKSRIPKSSKIINNAREPGVMDG